MMDSKRREALGEALQARPVLPIPEFDELVALAKQHPEQYEALRLELCEQLIASAPVYMRQRLQGLQFQIDMERKKSGSSMSACIRLSQLMNESLLKLNAALSNPSEYLKKYYGKSADVIPMFEATQS